MVGPLYLCVRPGLSIQPQWEVSSKWGLQGFLVLSEKELNYLDAFQVEMCVCVCVSQKNPLINGKSH